MLGMTFSVPSSVCQPTAEQLIDCPDCSPSPHPPLFPGVMILQSRGCVDRGWDGIKHKPNLSPFNPPQTSPKMWKHRKKARSPDERLSTHRGNWKQVWREKGEPGREHSGRAPSLCRYFLVESLLDGSAGLQLPSGESELLSCFAWV